MSDELNVMASLPLSAYTDNKDIIRGYVTVPEFYHGRCIFITGILKILLIENEIIFC